MAILDRLTPEAIADLLAFVVKMAIPNCRCDEADLHDEAMEILARHKIEPVAPGGTKP